ncbi:MAG TPA: MOSC domain-containing protein [Anaerolineales bacterium]|nr:MOSC domain-containing protein [Anaerolineales bacterium]
MQLVSVNVSPQPAPGSHARASRTGIYKVAVQGRVKVGQAGVEHDFIADQKNHGGPDQAVYVYGTVDYEWWDGELGKDLEPGTFGENLTISDLESAALSIGDRLRIAGLTLEISAPRFPCSTLARRMGDSKFSGKFRRAERPGVYCRVIAPGLVQAGDLVSLEPYDGETLSVLQMFREYYLHTKDEAALRRSLRAPISQRARTAIEQQLREVVSPGRS